MKEVRYIREKKEIAEIIKAISSSPIDLTSLKIDVDNVIQNIDTENSGLIQVGDKYYWSAFLIAHSLNKHRADVQANYLPSLKNRGIPYADHIFTGEDIPDEAWFKVKALLKESKIFKRVVRQSIFLSPLLAWDYITRTQEVRYTVQLEKGYIKNKPLDIIYQDEKLYISSLSISDQLGSDHQNIVNLLSKYEDFIFQFGTYKKETYVDKKEKIYTEITYYLLNEDQCYFLGTLSRNSEKAVQFKSWLVHQFSNAKKMLSHQYSLLDEERIYHTELAHLCMYTNHTVQTEYPIEVLINNKGVLKKGIRRIDLFIDESVAIELKKTRINSETVRETIATRGYYHSLKKYPNFKYLIISSPAGITYEAAKLLEVMYPHVIYLSPNQIATKMAKAVIERYPASCKWWLGHVVFQQFPHLFTKEQLKEFQKRNSPIWKDYQSHEEPKLKLIYEEDKT